MVTSSTRWKKKILTVVLDGLTNTHICVLVSKETNMYCIAVKKATYVVDR